MKANIDMDCDKNDNIIVVDDSFDSIKSRKYMKYTNVFHINKKSLRSMLMKYTIFLVLASLLGLGLYFDYKCTNNIVPNDYLVDVHKMVNINNTNNINFRKLMGNQCGQFADCGNGQCTKDYNCKCNEEYITVNNDICNYHQLSGLTAFMLSIFFGICGVDQCYLARGHAGDICLGIIKALTVGGIGVWWIHDMIWTSYNWYNDGNGYPLTPV